MGGSHNNFKKCFEYIQVETSKDKLFGNHLGIASIAGHPTVKIEFSTVNLCCEVSLLF